MSLNQEQYLDLVQQAFPSVGETEARLRLNQAIKEFCAITHIFHKDISLSTDGATVTWPIDASVVRIDDVFEGVNTFQALQKRPEHYSGGGDRRVYHIDGTNISVGLLGEGLISALATGLTVTLKTRAKVEDFTEFIRLLDNAGDPLFDLNGDPIYVVADAFTAGPEVPEQFHEAPIYRALMDLYLLPSDRHTVREGALMHNMYDAKWRGVLNMAKGFDRKGTGFTITKHWF